MMAQNKLPLGANDELYCLLVTIVFGSDCHVTHCARGANSVAKRKNRNLSSNFLIAFAAVIISQSCALGCYAARDH